MYAENSPVSAAPNESKIRGEIVKIERGPEGLGQIWTVKIEDSQNVGAAANFTRSKIHENISIYIHPDFKKHFDRRDAIEARVKFEGDAFGGAFFLADDAVRRLDSPEKAKK